jgi:hypothetical protein
MMGHALALSSAARLAMQSREIGSSDACGISPPLTSPMLLPGLASWYAHYLEQRPILPSSRRISDPRGMRRRRV